MNITADRNLIYSLIQLWYFIQGNKTNLFCPHNFESKKQISNAIKVIIGTKFNILSANYYFHNEYSNLRINTKIRMVGTFTIMLMNWGKIKIIIVTLFIEDDVEKSKSLYEPLR